MSLSLLLLFFNPKRKLNFFKEKEIETLNHGVFKGKNENSAFCTKIRSRGGKMHKTKLVLASQGAPHAERGRSEAGEPGQDADPQPCPDPGRITQKTRRR